MQVHIAPNEVWPVLGVEDSLGPEDPEVPSELVTDWLNATTEVRKAEDRILLHLKRSGQAVPEAFRGRVEGLDR